MEIPFRIALENALGIAIGLMAVEILGRTVFNLSLGVQVLEHVVF